MSLLEVPDMGSGSGYCDNSDESVEHGLDRHDYRITILRVETTGIENVMDRVCK